MINQIILASKSKIRKQILNKNNIKCDVIPSNLDEDEIKKSQARVQINLFKSGGVSSWVHIRPMFGSC